MKKIIYLLLLSMLLSACSLLYPLLNPYKSYQDDFDYKLDRVDPADGISSLSSLFNYKDNTWDELVFYGPYSYRSKTVKDELGISISYLNDSNSDGDWVLIFVDKDENTYSLKYLLHGNGYEVSQSVSDSDNHYLSTEHYEAVGESGSGKIKLIHKNIE